MMSIIAGSLFGTTFVLPVALKEGSLGGHHSAYIMDYVFSHFIGIFLTSTTALLIYAPQPTLFMHGVRWLRQWAHDIESSQVGKATL